MRKPSMLIPLLILLTSIMWGGELRIDKVEPPNWWVGMKWNKVQLMVYGDNLGSITARFNDEAIRVEKIHEIDNTSYAFIDVVIPDALAPGTYTLYINNGGEEVEYDYEILARDTSPDRNRGFNNEDVIYLITPDRFADGDTTNNNVEGFGKEYDRTEHLGRHGGDLRGIINKLDYIRGLGVTAIWLNPVVENNTFISYHGYAATDFYQIDPRYGDNEMYKEFVEEARKRGLKVILDHVANHISIDHPWMKNLPVKDWINGEPKNHKNAEHSKMSFFDPNADSTTIKQVTEGWFVDYMPDLNQRNPYMANYIVQNTIWWLEYTGLDGIREDTYPYVDQEFMAEWNRIILDEYPNLNILGEVWTGNPAFLAAYQTGTIIPREYDSNLPTVTDFGMRDTYTRFLEGKDNLYNIFETFSKDYLYSDPNSLVVFLDNHDVIRAMFAADTNHRRVKLGLTMLLTTRGIPQIFYGTEIGIVGDTDHGYIRAEFPGGFPGYERNAFTRDGRTDVENDLYDHLTTLLQLRKEYKALAAGEFTHYPPKDGVYLYTKTYGGERFLIAINETQEEKEAPLWQVKHRMQGIGELKDVLNKKTVPYNEDTVIKLAPESSAIYLLN